MDHPRHTFVHGDIADRGGRRAARARPPNIVVHFAAETHVDRSILSAGEFITTDVFGTFVLLEAAREAPGLRRFVQISTDEVYGSVPEGSSRETDELRPRNPYSASKAGADRLAYSYWATYGVPVVITRASNNYGPYQFPEKVIPLFITNAIDDMPVPLYGDGLNERDWLHVEDHCRAVDLLIDAAEPGEVYNIGGGNDVRNIDLTQPHPRARRQAGVADPSGRGSARPRPALFARHVEAAGARLAAAGAVRGGPCATRSRGTGRTSGGGGRSRTAIPPSAPTTTRSTASAASDARRAWSSSGHRRHRLCRQPPVDQLLEQDAVGRRLVASAADAPPGPATRGVHWSAVDLLDAARWLARLRRCRPSVDLSLRRHRPCRRVVGAAGPGVARQRARHASRARGRSRGRPRVPRARHRVGAGLPAIDRAADRGRSDRPSDPYGVSKLAQEMLAAARDADAGVHRPAVQPCRSAPIADLRRPRASRGRSRRSKRAGASRCCGSATWMRAATSPTSATRFAPTSSSFSTAGRARPYNVCSGQRVPCARLARCAGRACRTASIEIEMDPARLRPSDNPVDRRRPIADQHRDRLGAGRFRSSEPLTTCSTTGAGRPPAHDDERPPPLLGRRPSARPHGGGHASRCCSAI